jgi:demethylmenaquinone methyltransferase/2-methoxy-6-polyprenyl-1,4-benzoquinol methylase
MGMSEKPHTVELFTEVAPKYEFLNTVMTAGMDRSWRRAMLDVSEAALGAAPQDALDLATGTGDVPRMMASRWPKTKIIGTDPTAAMLEVAKKKKSSTITWQEGVAESLSFEDESLDLITIAFGFRNVAEGSRLRAAQEAFRVLRPGGVFAILELGLPAHNPWRKSYILLLRFGMPTFAGMFGPRAAYKYLSKSILEFPPPENIRRLLNKAGFTPFAPRPLSMGMTWLYIGKKTTQKADS